MTNFKAMTVLVLGASGMLGNAVLRSLGVDPRYAVFGTVRNKANRDRLPISLRPRVRIGIDVEDFDALTRLFADVRPDAVINCIGVVKQVENSDDPLTVLPINAVLPHRLAGLSALARARFVHISTDCVFDGRDGNYNEGDRPNAEDLYGRSKLLGEVDAAHAVTLRTSIIGHELGTSHGLVEWFLAQQNPVKGYRRAVFSGIPTVELARIIKDVVLPRPSLRGLYHVSADPISKHDLLGLVAEEYGKQTEIVADDAIRIDRSLDSSRFRAETGYEPPAWVDLVRSMRRFG